MGFAALNPSYEGYVRYLAHHPSLRPPSYARTNPVFSSASEISGVVRVAAFATTRPPYLSKSIRPMVTPPSESIRESASRAAVASRTSSAHCARNSAASMPRSRTLVVTCMPGQTWTRASKVSPSLTRSTSAGCPPAASRKSCNDDAFALSDGAARAVCSLPLEGGGLGRGSDFGPPPGARRAPTSPFQGEVRSRQPVRVTQPLVIAAAAPRPPPCLRRTRGRSAPSPTGRTIILYQGPWSYWTTTRLDSQTQSQVVSPGRAAPRVAMPRDLAGTDSGSHPFPRPEIAVEAASPASCGGSDVRSIAARPASERLNQTTRE